MMKITRFFPPPPVFEEEDKTTEAQLTHVVLQVLLGLTFLAGLRPLFIQKALLPGWILFGIVLVAFGALWSMMLLLQKGYLRLTNWLLISVFWLLVTGVLLTTGGLHSQTLFGYFPVVALAAMLLGERASIGMTVLCITLAALAQILGEKKLLPVLTPSPDLFTVWFSASVYLIIFAMLQNAAAKTLRKALLRARTSEAQYREQRDLLQALMDNIPDMIYFKDTASRFIRINRSQAKLLGVTDPAQANQKTDMDYLPQELAQAFYEEEQTLIRTGKPVVDRLEFNPTQEGRPRWISATKVPLRAASGQLIGLVGISRDVTEREATRQMLEKQATELATVARVSAAISTRLDVSELLQTVVDLTQTQFKLYHAHIYLLSDDEKTLTVAAGTGEVGRRIQTQGWQIPCDHPHSIVARVARTRHGALYNDIHTAPDFLPNPLLPNTRAEITVPILAADQLLGIFDLQSDQVERFKEEDIQIYTALAQQLAVALQNARRYELAQAEIAERKRAEEALRATEHLFRAAIEAAGAVPYSIQYGADRYTFMGEGIQNLLGYKSEEMTPEVWATLIEETIMLGQGSGLSRIDAMKKAVAGSLKIWQADYRIRLPNDEIRWLSDASVQLPDETGHHTGAIGILQDITERKRVEEALQRLNLDLEKRVEERTAQLEAAHQELESFSYTVSHDLRSPVRAMIGFTAILLEEYAYQIPLGAQNYLQHIRTGAERLGQLVDGLLTFTRLGRQHITRHRFDVTSLVRQVYNDLLELQLGRKITFTLDELPPCEADPALFKQLLIQLLDNAFKYTQAEPEPHIHMGYREKNGTPIYFVRDNGIGFDMQYAHKLFGVFQQLHLPGEYEGTGIGLALVKRILEKHGGRIWAEAEPGQGATFYFTLSQTPLPPVEFPIDI